MLGSVFAKSLRDQRRSLGWWSLGLVLLTASIIAFFPSIRDNADIEELMKAYPEGLMALFGASDLENITSAAGFLNVELFGFMVPLLFIVFAVGLGSGAIAGEEGRATMEILLAEPVDRGRVVLEKSGAMIAATVVLGIVLWVAMVVGAVAVDMDIGPVRFAEAVLTVTLLGLTFGGLALAIGCITGNRGLALGVSSAAAVSTFVADALGEIADFIDPAKWVSPFYYYNDANVLANGLNPAHAAVLAATAAVLVGIGYRAFQRRDLHL